DHLVLGAERRHRHHRAEYFLSVDTTICREFRDDGRREEVAVAEPRLRRERDLPTENAASLLARQREIGQHLLAVLLLDQRAQLGAWIERITDPERPGPRTQPVEEVLVDA